MGKFSDYLLVSDFDRTFTDRSSRIPRANLEAVSYFMQEGGAFTMATGRSLTMARYRFREIPMNAPMVCFNGAACYDLEAEQLLFCHPLAPDGTALMQHYVNQYPDLLLEVHCLDAHYVFHPTEDRDDYFRRQHASFVHTEDWNAVPELRINFAIYGRGVNPYAPNPDPAIARRFLSLKEDIERRGQGRYTATNSLPGMVEVQLATGSKGIAARELANRLHRPILVAAGDALNDIPMLDEADLAFLAADGEEAMHRRGYRLAAPCEDGTIADVIRQLEP